MTVALVVMVDLSMALVVMVDLSFALMLKIDLSICECYKAIDVSACLIVPVFND